MATNARLIQEMRKIVTLADAANKIEEIGNLIVADAMNARVMNSAGKLDAIVNSMCDELRRLCAEPYGDAK